MSSTKVICKIELVGLTKMRRNLYDTMITKHKRILLYNKLYQQIWRTWIETLIIAFPIKVAKKNFQNGTPNCPHSIPAKSNRGFGTWQKKELWRFPTCHVSQKKGIVFQYSRTAAKTMHNKFETFLHVLYLTISHSMDIFWNVLFL